MNIEKKWYVLYTKPRAEKKIKLSLDAMEIDNFLPLIPQKKKWSDRYKIIETPLFSSYIFVKIDYQKESLKVLKDPNSVNFLFFQGKPANISDEEVEMLQIFVEQYPEKIKIEEANLFQKGKEITIKSGPFQGRKAIVEKVKNSTYVVVYIPLLHKKAKVEIKREDVEIII
jgi:transcription antitermination factor NusG